LPPELRKIHEVVREAQQAGIDAVKPGAVGKEVDALVRKVISDEGFEPFDHGLGHGVGLEIHEGPGLAASSDDVLPVGAAVTVEPGVYVAGLGGVRIEDVVEVTPEGCRPLPTSTRELIEL
jgi:Xaa-Pro aminopeptidase